MQELGLSQVCDEIAAAFSKDDYKRVEALLWPALDQFPETPQLWFYAGNLFFQTGRVAPSVRCFEYCIELDENPLVLANLAAAYRRLNKHDAGIMVGRTALDREPNYEPALVNLGSMFVNEGTPQLGIPYLEKAMRIGEAKGKTERGVTWNLSLLYLEAGRFKEGFELYRKGLGAERLMRTYGKGDIPEPEVLEPHHDGAGKTLIVFGEQGIGDELMAGTIIEEARKEFAEVIFECHPRLEELHRVAHPGMRLFPTRKDEHILWPITENIRADYKCPILDLAARYRPDAASFERSWSEYGPTYTATIEETQRYRAQLELIAQGRPIVALATRGGVMQTARQYRTIRAAEIDHLFSNTDCLFVSIDYDDMSGLVEYVDEKHGQGRFHWLPSIVQHWDYDHCAALIAACDMTVTVCQSAAHLSAGLGKPTRVLTPQRCAWRYASVSSSETWYWYPDPAIKLYRQDDPQSWIGPLNRVIADIKELQR